MSLASFSYKISLIKCLIDTPFEIYNNWNSFQNDMENIKSNLFKNAYPPFLIDKVITLDYQISANFHTIPKKKKKSELSKEFCKNIFNNNSFKIKNYFSYRNPIPHALKSFLV